MSQTTYDRDDSMPPNRPTPFPLETMTDHQRKIFTQFLEAKYKTVNVVAPISFARLLIRDKPGMVLTPLVIPSGIEYSPTISIQDLPEAFDLEYFPCKNDDLYVARTSWRLDLVPLGGEQSDGFHYRTGVFLGYSPDDVRHYFQSEPPDTRPEELVLEGVFNLEEIANTIYLPQRHDDSITGYEHAIQRGKNIRDIITEYADKWDLPELERYVEHLHQLACCRYSS